MTDLFKHCPKCTSTNISFKNLKVFSCNSCNYTYFHNVAGAVGVMLKYNNKVLWVKRNQEPKKNKLDLPGGFIDPKESAEEAAVREINEELYLKIIPKDLTYLGSFPNTYKYKNILYNTIDLFYEYNLKKIVSHFNKTEINNLYWKTIGEIKLNELAFNSQKQCIKKLKKSR